MKDIMPTLKYISRKIAEFRKKNGMTQAEFAQKLNKSRVYIVELESNNATIQPTVTVLYDIAEIFNCKITDFLPLTKLDILPPEIHGEKPSKEAEMQIQKMLEEARNAN